MLQMLAAAAAAVVATAGGGGGPLRPGAVVWRFAEGSSVAIWSDDGIDGNSKPPSENGVGVPPTAGDGSMGRVSPPGVPVANWGPRLKTGGGAKSQFYIWLPTEVIPSPRTTLGLP